MAGFTNIQGHDFRKTLVGGETTLGILSRVLAETVTEYKPVPDFVTGRAFKNYYQSQNVDCDEVYPGIFIGDVSTAKNKKFLMKIGITHVLNAAEGDRFGYVNTSQYYYRDTPLKYLGLPLADLPTVDISKYFHTAANFIEDALATSGKVLVHCMMGISRSSTCVIAYLMIKRHMLAEEAIRLLRKNRCIYPNQGFLQQLATLDNHLRRHRL